MSKNKRSKKEKDIEMDNQSLWWEHTDIETSFMLQMMDILEQYEFDTSVLEEKGMIEQIAVVGPNSEAEE